MQLIFYISVFNILMVKVKKKKSDLTTDQNSERKDHVERRQILKSQGPRAQIQFYPVCGRVTSVQEG